MTSYLVPAALFTQLDIAKAIGAVGAHKFVVLPGLTRPPDGFPTFFTTMVFEILQPFKLIAVTTKLKVPAEVYV